MNVAWLSSAPPSPVAQVVLAHARVLAERHGFEGETATRPAGAAGRFDVAVAIGLGPAEALMRTDAARRVLLVHDLEDRTPAPGSPERAIARLSLDLPVAFLATSGHVADALARLRPDAACRSVRLGVDARGGARPPADGGALRVHPADAEARAVLADAPGARLHVAGSPADADVVLALAPPADPTDAVAVFDAGATCVAAEAPALAGVLVHGVNGLLCEPGDTRGPLRQLELLDRDRDLLGRLRDGARATAAGWPGVEEAAGDLAAALRALAESPAPDGAVAAAAMLADLRGTLEEQRAVLRERDALAARLEPIERVVAHPVVRRLLARRRR